MNIFGVFSTHGATAANAVKGVEAAEASRAAAAQQGVGQVHDAVTLSVDAVRSPTAPTRRPTNSTRPSIGCWRVWAEAGPAGT